MLVQLNKRWLVLSTWLRFSPEIRRISIRQVAVNPTGNLLDLSDARNAHEGWRKAERATRETIHPATYTTRISRHAFHIHNMHIHSVLFWLEANKCFQSNSVAFIVRTVITSDPTTTVRTLVQTETLSACQSRDRACHCSPCTHGVALGGEKVDVNLLWKREKKRENCWNKATLIFFLIISSYFLSHLYPLFF